MRQYTPEMLCKKCGHVTEEFRVRPVYNTCECKEGWVV